MGNQAPALPAYLERLLERARTHCGGSRIRQLRWVLLELVRFADLAPTGKPAVAGTTPPRPGRPRGRGWLSPAFVASFLDAADSGALRTRTSRRQVSPGASRRVRRDCLRVLAREAGLPDPVPDRPSLPEPASRVENKHAARALAQLRSRAGSPSASDADVREAALAALTRTVGLRTGELAALTVTSLGEDARTLTYQPRPPAAQSAPEVRTVELDDTTAHLMRRWLEVRARLVAATNGPVHALWVSVHGNHDGSGTRRPAGMPLHPNGIRRAHARAVAALNVELVGEPGWSPLPYTPGRFRSPLPGLTGAPSA